MKIRTNNRVGYYLLDYKDKNPETFRNYFGDKRLKDLSSEEFIKFFEVATEMDLQRLKT